MVKLYTDGSFNIYTKAYGGAMIYSKDGVEEEFSFSGNEPELAKSQQIPGELMAVVFGITKALNNGETEVTLQYDYKGIEEWATNGWVARKTISKNYKSFMQDAMKKIKITFVWVKSHKGNKMEKRVDTMAKKACGVPIK